MPNEPGIDIRKLKPGTTVFLEAELCLYEIKVVHPVHGIIEISSNDPQLRVATVGQLLHSVTQGAPIPGWIGKGLALDIRFRNGTYRTRPVTAAEVSGRHEDSSRWSYEVF